MPSKDTNTLVNYSIISAVAVGVLYLINSLVQSVSSSLANILMFIAFIALVCLAFFIIYKLIQDYRAKPQTKEILPEGGTPPDKSAPSKNVTIREKVESMANPKLKPYKDTFKFVKKKVVDDYFDIIELKTIKTKNPIDTTAGRGGRRGEGGEDNKRKETSEEAIKNYLVGRDDWIIYLNGETYKGKNVKDRTQQTHIAINKNNKIYIYTWKENPYNAKIYKRP